MDRGPYYDYIRQLSIDLLHFYDQATLAPEQKAVILPYVGHVYRFVNLLRWLFSRPP